MTRLWSIRLLGGLDARREGHIVHKFQSKKTGSLLAHLAFFLDCDIKRDVLVDKLWSGIEIEKARHSLAESLSSIRRQLEPPDLPRHSVILSDHARIRLLSSAVSTDVQRFTAQAYRALSAQDNQERISLCVTTLQEYAGELLPGLYDNWVLDERERIASIHFRVAAALVNTMVSEERHTEALEHVLAALSHAPDREQLHCLVLGLHISLGHIREAVDHFVQYRDHLLFTENSKPGQNLQKLIAPYLTTSSSQPTKTRVRSRRRKNEISLTAPQTARHELAFPTPINRFFGREKELEFICRQLSIPVDSDQHQEQDTCRLVNITGLGGTGKTRLATEGVVRLQKSYDGRIIYLQLSGIQRSLEVLPLVRAQLNANYRSNSVLNDIVYLFGDEPALLIMDNCEQLVPEIAGDITALLDSVPALRILATSRLPLRNDGETIVPLKPLAVPIAVTSPQALYDFPSVQMFVNRAQAVSPDFQVTDRNAASISRIAERLEGIPLAIELAAARARSMTALQIAQALENRFSVLISRNRGNARHRTLSDVIDWSYSLLTPQMSAFFNTLLIFRSSFTIDAICSVSQVSNPINLVEELIDLSLLSAEPDHHVMRFSILDTIKEYAASGTMGFAPDLQIRYIDYFLNASNALAAQIAGTNRRAALREADKQYHDVMNALHLATGSKIKVQFAANMWRYWDQRGLLQEGISCLTDILARDTAGRTKYDAEALHGLGVLKERIGDIEGARLALTESLNGFQLLGSTIDVARVNNNIAILHEKSGDYESASRACAKGLALAQQIGDPASIAACLNTQARLQRYNGDTTSALIFLRKALSMYEAAGDTDTAAAVLHNIGCIASDNGDLVEARIAFVQSLVLFKEISHPSWTAFALHNLGDTKCRQGDYTTGFADLVEALMIRFRLGDHAGIASSLDSCSAAFFTLSVNTTAVTIASAAHLERTKYRVPATPSGKRKFDAMIVSLRSSLGQDNFTIAWKLGAFMTGRQVVDYVVESSSTIGQVVGMG